MRLKKLAVIAALLIFAQGAVFSQDLIRNPSQLTIYSKVSSENPEITFYQKYDILTLALFIYKYDALKRYEKDVLKETIMTRHDNTFFNLTGVRFDLENIDIGKKGWTRYYPFSIDSRSYIIRIFLTEERPHQPEVSVLFEGSIKKPSVTFQILPGVNAILQKCGIERRDLFPTVQVTASP